MQIHTVPLDEGSQYGFPVCHNDRHKLSVSAGDNINLGLGVCLDRHRVPDLHHCCHLERVSKSQTDISHAFRVWVVSGVHDSLVLRGDSVTSCLRLERFPGSAPRRFRPSAWRHSWRISASVLCVQKFLGCLSLTSGNYVSLASFGTAEHGVLGSLVILVMTNPLPEDSVMDGAPHCRGVNTVSSHTLDTSSGRKNNVVPSFMVLTIAVQGFCLVARFSSGSSFRRFSTGAQFHPAPCRFRQ